MSSVTDLALRAKVREQEIHGGRVGWGLEATAPHACFLCPTVGVFREATTEFSVDARALTQTGGPHVKARVSNPSGNLTETYVQDCGDGTYKVEYTPYEEGMYGGALTGGGCHTGPDSA